eukprot:scaffold40308_cov60-Phaeocystis_antarctica.AAC.2
MAWAGLGLGLGSGQGPRLLGDGVAMMARYLLPRAPRRVRARLVQQHHLPLPQRPRLAPLQRALVPHRLF